MKKKCMVCCEIKNFAEFPRRKYKSGQVVYRNKCIGCMNKYKRELHKSPEQIRKMNVVLNNVALVNVGKKVCCRCFNQKKLTDFHKGKDLGNTKSWCKVCRKNVESKRYNKNSVDKRSKYKLNRYKNDVNFRLSECLRNRVRQALKNNQKSGSAVRDLGCSVEFLRQHLEQQWQPGMSWENYGVKGWHIDHIKPLVSFDLTNRQEFLEACHYTNLQPLWAEENLSKGVTFGDPKLFMLG